jgi:hypothetical protein
MGREMKLISDAGAVAIHRKAEFLFCEFFWDQVRRRRGDPKRIIRVWRWRDRLAE